MALPEPADSSTALITGASSGIGVELARQFAARGYNVTLAARREDLLHDLAVELAREHGVRAEVVAADLGSVEGRDRLAARVDEHGLAVEILANNAGFGGTGKASSVDPASLVAMVAINCEAVVDLQARFTRTMVERGRGAVINTASTAAFQPIPGTATYAATKAFVLSLSEATHSELKSRGVTVTALCPGPVQTEFTDVAGIGGWEENLPGVFWTPVEIVAREAIEGADKGKRVVVPGLMNRAGAMTGQHSPRMLSLPLIKRIWRAGV